jgi:hypothetical protein
VGLNEEFWLQPPPERIIEYAQRTWEIEPDILTVDDWIALLQGAGLSDVVTSVYRFSARREASQMKRYSARDMFKMFSRTLRLYLDGEFRAYMAERRGTPKDLFEYLGYALFVARA